MRKNNKTNNSDYKKTTALVFDRFYGERPNAALVIFERILMAAAIAFLGMGYVFSQYDLPVNKTAMAFVSAGVAVAFSLLFTVVKKRAAIPVMIFVSGILILWRFNAFWRKFSYFVDAVVLQCDGRMFETTGSTIHPLEQIQTNGMYTKAYVDGVIFGSVILCMLFALITAAGLIGKPRILPSLAAFLLLWIPRLASERLFFDWRLIPLVALYAGAIAIGAYYRDGLAIRHVYVAGGYRRKLAMDDRRFNATVRAQSAGQRAVSRGLHYSKYFSSVMSAAAIFAVLGIILSVVFADSTGIDYDPFYEKLQNINGGWGSNNISPFKNGPEASYFASPSNSIFKANNRLRLTSPSTSTKEIIRVTKPVSDKALYLRGDIGIDFDGVSWSSPVTEEPADWRGERLDKWWLPVEMSTLDLVRDYFYDFGFEGVGMRMNVDVEYLCDTDVVFVPAYDERYAVFAPENYNPYDFVPYAYDELSNKLDNNAFDIFYSAPSNGGSESPFDVFGDFAARRKTGTATGETLEYIASVPYYTDASDILDISYFRTACDAYNRYIVREDYINEVLSTKNNALGRGYFQSDYYTYIKYVYDHYLGVPESMKTQLDEFIERSGLNEERSRIKKQYAATFESYLYNAEPLVDSFLSAMAVSDFLKENYTYSLDAKIDRRNPVMSFLNNTKSGHCALYASAMTLILREWGIPARYCTGFAAKANLSMQTLRSKDLHAWCEVYLDELGWVTFDPTAAAIFDSQGGTGTPTTSASANSSTPESQSGTANSSQAQSSGVQSDTTSTASSSPQNSETHDPASDSSQASNTYVSYVSSESEDRLTFVQILPYLLMILAICAVAALTAWIVWLYIKLKKRAYKQIQSFHREKNSEYVYEKLLAVLRCCKLYPMSGEQPHEFFERAENTLGCAVCENYGLFEKLAFGETTLDASERAILGRALEKIYKAAEGRFKLFGKIKLRRLIIGKKV